MTQIFINREIAEGLLKTAINASVRTHRPVSFAVAMDERDAVTSQVVVMSASQAKQCEEILKSHGLLVLEVAQRDFE